MKEFALRDYLAANMALLEPGLELLGKEHYLRNNNGTSGFVDILAKDESGRLVVIEIKVDKSSEREAVTELMKYVALLRNSRGLRNSELRLIVVSTDWRELLTPLSEFRHNTDYNIQAIHAITQPDGTATFSPIALHTETSERHFATHHWLQIYNDAAERDKRRQEFSNSVKSRGINNFILADIIVENQFGTFPSFYFAQQLEPVEFFERIVSALGNETLEELQEYYDDEEDYHQHLAGAAYGGLSVDAKELEISHPEKFKGWYERGVFKVEIIHRSGRFLADQLLTDDRLIFELCGFDGTANSWFLATCKPGDRARAAEIKSKSATCIAYNDRWRQSMSDILDIAGANDQTGFALSIFNPENIIESIGNFVREKNPSYLPSFTVVMEDALGLVTRVFRGFVESTGVAPTTDIESIIAREYGDNFTFLMSSSMGARALNETTMEELGLRYNVACEEYKGTSISPTTLFDVKIRSGIPRGVTHPTGVSLFDWIQENPTIVAQALEIYENHVIRIGDI